MVCVRVCVCGAYFEHVLLFCRNGVTALCARSRGKPSSAHCEQRLSERLTPCPCDPVCAFTGMRGHAGRREKQPIKQSKCWQNDAAEKPKKPCISVSDPKRSAASRAGMAGWAGEGGGRFGERREYVAPTLTSTPRQHGAARHQTRQPRNSLPPQKPGQKRHTTSARRGSPPNTSAGKRQPRNSTPPQKPGQKRHATSARHGSPPHTSAQKWLPHTSQSRNRPHNPAPTGRAPKG